MDEYKDLKWIITKANSDADGRVINSMIDDYVAEHSNRCIAFTSMGQLRYLSAMKYCSMVVGNSSSGIIEAPSFKVPTVNIGNRQKGRMAAESVIHCRETKKAIKEAIDKALSPEFGASLQRVENPYEKACTSQEIIRVIKDYLLEDKIDLKKKFYDYQGRHVK